MDKQCREYILLTKRKLFGIAQQRTPNDAVLNVRNVYSRSYWNVLVLDSFPNVCSGRLGKVPFSQSSYCYHCPPPGERVPGIDWNFEKFFAGTKITILKQVHWRTQARCIYHRIIYTNIDIHEKLRYTSNHLQVCTKCDIVNRLRIAFSQSILTSSAQE